MNSLFLTITWLVGHCNFEDKVLGTLFGALVQGRVKFALMNDPPIEGATMLLRL
jgi:hypothetical protein